MWGEWKAKSNLLVHVVYIVVYVGSMPPTKIMIWNSKRDWRASMAWM